MGLTMTRAICQPFPRCQHFRQFPRRSSRVIEGTSEIPKKKVPKDTLVRSRLTFGSQNQICQSLFAGFQGILDPSASPAGKLAESASF